MKLFKSACLSAVFFVAVAALVATPALAEILILKDGTKVQCRILSRTDSSVTIRNASGSEITYPLREVDRIDDSMSSVELYEGVAESITPRSGLAAYYLGLWTQEVETERQLDTKTLFRIAAATPDVRGRALYKLALLEPDRQKAIVLLEQAVANDPTLREALDRLERSARASEKLMPEMMTQLAKCLDDMVKGNYGSALTGIKRIMRTSNPSAVAGAKRFIADGTGMAFDTLMSRLSMAAKNSPGSTSTSKLKTSSDCTTCAGTGHLTCNMCGGNGYMSCKTCSGKHVVKVTKRNSHTGTTTTYKKCRACNASGAKDCPVCLRRIGGPRTETKSYGLRDACTRCNGSGRIRSSTRYTTGVQRTQICLSCEGNGYRSRLGSATFSYSGSGIRRCQKCNRDGKIARPDAPVPRRPHTPTNPAYMAPSRVFGMDTRSRLSGLADKARLIASGERSAVLDLGRPIPMYSRAISHQEDDLPVFACGRWQDKGKARTAQKRARALMHKPRPVDISAFIDWMVDREMSELETRAVEVGSAGRGAVRGLVATYERNKAIGQTPLFDETTIFKTTFKPGSSNAADVAVCRWKLSGTVGGSGSVELTLLRDPTVWPALDVTANTKQSSLDMGAVAKDVMAKTGLRAHPMTVYYRVAGSRRLARGEEEDATAVVSLEIEPIAITLGSGKSIKIWTAAGQSAKANN